jgi:hypothetical protein
LAVGIIAELRKIYRAKAKHIMSRCTSANVLIQGGRVLTDEMFEERLLERR